MSRTRVLVGLWLTGVLALAGVPSAEDFRAEASVDRRAVGVGEPLTLTISVFGGDKVSEPDLGNIDGFRVVNTSTSRNISIVNMKMTRSLNLQYTLVALKQGEYELGPFTVASDNQTYETGSVRVTVTKGRAPSQSGQAGAQSDEDLVLLTASVDKSKAYVGQQITYTVKFAYRVRLLSGTQYIPPDHTGFWFEDMGETGPEIETIRGTQYYVLTRRTAFFPISSGKFTIGEAGVRFEVRELDPFSRDPFSLFGRDPFGAFGRREGAAQTTPIEIEVLPLPRQGRPADFTGAVGKFSLSATASAQEVRVGESLTLSIRVRGRGNLKSIGEIPLPEIRDFRVFAPKAREVINADGQVVGGEKIFDLVLVPQRPGNYTLEGFDFSYFDPEKASYVVTTAEPVRVEVLPADESVAGQLNESGLETRIARQDIRYVKRVAIDRDDLTLSSGGATGMLIKYLPVLIALAGIVISIQRRRAAGSGRAGARRAFRVLVGELKAAERLLAKEARTADASGCVGRAIRKYIAARTGVGESVVDEAFVGSMARVSPERRTEIGRLFGDLDRIRFSPVSPDRAELEQILEKARSIFSMVDKEWK
ncbi:MAG: BatD family protein [Candidatus Eisenbacteria bacterium]